MRIVTTAAALIALCALGAVHAEETGAVLAHPIFRQQYTCAEHWEGNLPGIADALGSDCVIQRMVEENGRAWMRPYRSDGRANEDWFGWNQEVLSPCSCEVVRIQQNGITNQPGTMGQPPAAAIEFKRDDGVFFVIAHVQSINVSVGQKVLVGQVVAKVGNNGMARHPHIHIGAWKGSEPLQLRFDLHELGKMLRE